jgi:hypothetical protein
MTDKRVKGRLDRGTDGWRTLLVTRGGSSRRVPASVVAVAQEQFRNPGSWKLVPGDWWGVQQTGKTHASAD